MNQFVGFTKITTISEASFESIALLLIPAGILPYYLIGNRKEPIQTPAAILR